jgi:hypothetical protein
MHFDQEAQVVSDEKNGMEFWLLLVLFLATLLMAWAAWEWLMGN